jgi:hypothetical protein
MLDLTRGVAVRTRHSIEQSHASLNSGSED